jgi:hypothetical protein
MSALETLRRIAESVIIAVISAAGLYFVGSVYVGAYYGRLAIEATSLDLPPPVRRPAVGPRPVGAA